ncbi:TPA: hypothetical protein ACNVDX_005155, partial [Citrobacter gillenii]
PGVVGGTVIAIVALNDAKGRPSSGHADMLNASVNVPPNISVALPWQESDDTPGSYFAAYEGVQPGSGLKATLNLNDGSKQSNPFEIHSRTK